MICHHYQPLLSAMNINESPCPTDTWTPSVTTMDLPRVTSAQQPRATANESPTFNKQSALEWPNKETFRSKESTKKAGNQGINQGISQLAEQTNQPTNQPNQPTNQPTSTNLNQATNLSTNQAPSHPQADIEREFSKFCRVKRVHLVVPHPHLRYVKNGMDDMGLVGSSRMLVECSRMLVGTSSRSHELLVGMSSRI